jgi:hypothetical protein
MWPSIVTLRSMSTDRALWRLAGRGLDINTVIDIGASDSRWSAVCEKHYPACYYQLVEAQAAHAQALEAYCAARPKAQYVLAVAGDECGEVYFDDKDLFGGVASKTPSVDAHKVMHQTAPTSARLPTGRRGPFNGLPHRTVGTVTRSCPQFAALSCDPVSPCSFVRVIVKQPR